MPPALLRMQRPATGRRETECVERTAPMVSEQELIERIRRGDLVSFKAVFERYYGGVHAFTRGVVDNGFHAEEITQNVFIRLWLKREALDPSRNFKAFLYTLARHEIADYFRSEYMDPESFGNRKPAVAMGLKRTKPTLGIYLTPARAGFERECGTADVEIWSGGHGHFMFLEDPVRFSDEVVSWAISRGLYENADAELRLVSAALAV